MTTTPLTVLREAQRAVPAVKYAIGVGGIAAVVAIVAGWGLDLRIAVFGTVTVFALMFVLVAFAALAALGKKSLVPVALALAWSFALLTVAISVLLVSSYFFSWPRPIDSYLSSGSSSGASSLTVSPSPQASPSTSVTSGSSPKHPATSSSKLRRAQTLEIKRGRTLEVQFPTVSLNSYMKPSTNRNDWYELSYDFEPKKSKLLRVKVELWFGADGYEKGDRIRVQGLCSPGHNSDQARVYESCVASGAKALDLVRDGHLRTQIFSMGGDFLLSDFGLVLEYEVDA